MKKNFLFPVVIIIMFSFVANAQVFSITIDAQKDAFYETLTGPADGYVYIPARAYCRDLGTGPTDDKDCSAKVWFSYDTNYIYCYAEVKDDIVRATNPTRYLNDCLELKFDPDPNNGTGTGTANSRLTAKGKDNAEDTNGVDDLNVSGNLKDAAGNTWVVTANDYARRLTSDGYALEFRIPFAYINVPTDNRFMIPREVNSVFGMAINIGDNDSDARDNVIQWSTGMSNNVHIDATQLGSVTFLAGNKLKLEAKSPRNTTINDSATVWYTPLLTGVHIDPVLIKSFYLSSNYPNPFNPSTTIKFSIPHEAHVSLAIYNTIGEKVTQLILKEMSAGVYSTEWNASGFASGVYFYRLQAGLNTSTKKLILIK
ncbi:MAG: sugar-binding protein [Bacteroidota bacterium]|jgi:hypothetical protein